MWLSGRAQKETWLRTIATYATNIKALIIGPGQRNEFPMLTSGAHLSDRKSKGVPAGGTHIWHYLAFLTELFALLFLKEILLFNFFFIKILQMNIFEDLFSQLGNYIADPILEKLWNINNHFSTSK